MQARYTNPTPDTLEIFTNPHPDRDYTIRHVVNEFTSLCPRTGLPDFATLEIEYIPHTKCVELKSLKYYLLQYRNHGAFYEDVTNLILNHLVEKCEPKYMKITARFNVRGGIWSVIEAVYHR